MVAAVDTTTTTAPRERVSEIIGRSVWVEPIWKSRVLKNVDATQTDYEFWDKLRRGKADGYRIAGLMMQPITEIIASWVFGDGVRLQIAQEPQDANNENDPIVYTNMLLGRFMERYHTPLMDSYTDALGLGDQYWVVNPDGTLSIPSPETVTVATNPLDYRTIDEIVIETTLDKAKVEDIYRDDGRTLKVTEWSTGSNGRKQARVTGEQEFANLIGRLPVVHFPNDRGTNEVYGHPIYEGMLHVISRYDDIIEKTIDGVELMGNPIPTMEGMDDIDATIAANQSIDDEDYTDADGNSEARTLINFDTLGMVFVGAGGSFKFASPNGGFTNDARNALKALFLLILDYTRIPEAVWGGELSSARATASEQMKPFYQYITWRRQKLTGQGADDALGVEDATGLLGLADVWLRMRALTDPRVVVGPVVAEWPPLADDDYELLIKAVELATGLGLLPDEEALQLLQLVNDPAQTVQRAQKEQEERREQAQTFETMLADAANEAVTAAQTDEPNMQDEEALEEGE